MPQSLMLKSVYADLAGERVPIIVDLGYLDDAAVVRAEAIIAAGVSKRNFRVEGFRRLMVELPPTKAARVLRDLPIVAGETYWRSTHHWRGLEGRDADHHSPAGAPR